MSKLSELICEDAIVADLEAATKQEAIGALVRQLVVAGRLPAEAEASVAKAILDRERQGTTGFGKGVAVPHAKHATVPAMAGAVGVSRGGIDFDSVDGRPVHSIVLLLSPANQSQQHLDAMQTVFKALHDDGFRGNLRRATDRGQVAALLAGM